MSMDTYSPYLARLRALFPEIATSDADMAYAAVLEEIRHSSGEQAAVMKQLRIAKSKLALLVATADLSGRWDLEKVMQALSEGAECTLQVCLRYLLSAAHARGEIACQNASDSGVMVIAMGKLGARELNYSSDIDLIIFFEAGKLGYQGRHNEQRFMNKLAHDLVQMMQERTADGYVFRTDLRLRPDPASMPPAITTDAAYYYYESVGQNWERAAMIKARTVAGDISAGERFLKNLSPFMWRRHLDFAAIQDIHSIKRQMDSRREKDIRVRGHNIKIGIGGIREIEFFAQIHQLIWGGREPRLRLRSTCETLNVLVEMGLIPRPTATALTDNYRYLRTLEHRLQMVADEQTHSLPTDEKALDNIARFMGYDSTPSFTRDLEQRLQTVHSIYASSFKGAEQLSGEGSLVFTGVSHDPDTLKTLQRMGYTEPEKISETVMGWHHGSSRATRTKRAREILTELMPTLLKRLAETADPDTAFLKFDEFLKNLPSGVQLFSLFHINPHLLGLIADIMGSAPRLAEKLSKSPSLLDAALYSDFLGALASEVELKAQLERMMTSFVNFEDRMDALRQFVNEKQFQAGVHLLKSKLSAKQTGVFLSQLADVVLDRTLAYVTEEFERKYGALAGGAFAIIGLGKLGSHEMTFGSDIDLVFVYDTPETENSASLYYNRLAQRFLNALTAMGRGGRLYEVDTRLRPSGEQGLLAVSMGGLKEYFSQQAWTFEFMAFTKARVVTSTPVLMPVLSAFIMELPTRPRDQEKLRTDVVQMRNRVEKEYGTQNQWDIKYVRGGLMDVDFIVQYLMLCHAPNIGFKGNGSAENMLNELFQNQKIDKVQHAALSGAIDFLTRIFSMLRLCVDRAFDGKNVMPGLQKLLCASVNITGFSELEKQLIAVEQTVRNHYNQLLEKSGEAS